MPWELFEKEAPSRALAPIPVGEVIGLAAVLASPAIGAHEVRTRQADEGPGPNVNFKREDEIRPRRDPQVAGILGALASTLAVFLGPVILAGLAAQQVERFVQNRWLREFGRGAAPTVVGLLCVTLVTLAHHTLSGLGYLAMALVAAGLGLATKVSPLLILSAAAIIGILLGR